MNKKELIEKVIIPIENKGGEAYFVGGCVRDELLNKTPNDYDIVTNFTPAQLHEVFNKFSNVSANAELFGVTMVLIDNEEIEIATFREDLTKGRHPEVSFNADMSSDAFRRDFTIDALYENKEGKIFDPTGFGLKDIKTKTLRFVGEPKERLLEDSLRAYRFVRFLSKGFNSSLSAPEMNDLRKFLDFSKVSKERKLKEIKKIFSSSEFKPHSETFIAAESFGIFYDIGLDDIFSKMENTIQSFKWHAEGALVISREDHSLLKAEEVKDFSDKIPYEHGTVLDHTYRVWEQMNEIIFHNKAIESTKVDFTEEKNFLLILSAILHDIGKTVYTEEKFNTFTWGKENYKENIPRVTKHDTLGVPLAEEFCKNLGLSNKETEFIATLVGQHMNAHKFADTKHKFNILEFVQQPLFKEIMLLAQADSRGSIKTVEEDQKSPEENLALPVVQECINTKMPKPILTGDILIAHGLKPNQSFGKMLKVAYRKQFEDNETDIERLYNFVKNLYTSIS